MPARAASRAAPPAADTSRATIPRNGGFTFAERPELEAPEARIVWHADLDPGTLNVVAIPTDSSDPDGVDPAVLAPWLTTVADGDGMEHAVLSDGWHHIRLDLDAGSLAGDAPVVFSYRIRGIASAMGKILLLRRPIDLCRYRRFATSLFPQDRRVERWLQVLRVAAGRLRVERVAGSGKSCCSKADLRTAHPGRHRPIECSSPEGQLCHCHVHKLPDPFPAFITTAPRTGRARSLYGSAGLATEPRRCGSRPSVTIVWRRAGVADP
nr:hypothetical protein [Sphingomonas bacterium]